MSEKICQRPRRYRLTHRFEFWKKSKAIFAEFRSDTRGTIAIVAAVMLPVLIGGMGLGVEVSHWYWAQRTLQHGADVSSHAAAVRKQQGDSNADLHRVALHVAEASGFQASAGTLEVNTPPKVSDTYRGNNGAVEVVLTRNMPRLFTAIFRDQQLTLSTHAVALVQDGSTACVLALSATKSRAINLTGNTYLTLDGCDMASNSDAEDAFRMQGAARLTTGCVHTVGGASPTQNLTLLNELDGKGPCAEGPNEYASPVPDPYAHLPNPTPGGLACDNDGRVGHPQQSVVVTPAGSWNGMPAKRFCSGLRLQGRVHFEPGIYFIEGGDFQINALAIVTGSGVTFVLGSGVRLSFSGNATIDLTAPSTGDYSGIVFFGARNAPPVKHTLSGNVLASFTGAIYTPTAEVSFSGNLSGSGSCTQIIADAIEFTGAVAMGSNCAGVGVSEISVAQVIRVVE